MGYHLDAIDVGHHIIDKCEINWVSFYVLHSVQWLKEADKFYTALTRYLIKHKEIDLFVID